jgi:phosphate starvation-inducible PhoH-like protein
MKMFLTRIGFNSKAIVTGDITQMDLPDGKKSGLKDVIGVLKNLEDIAFCYLTDRDVVRHRLVQQIIRAYERRDARRNEANKSDKKKT